jgi:hypothetical protein
LALAVLLIPALLMGLQVVILRLDRWLLLAAATVRMAKVLRGLPAVLEAAMGVMAEDMGKALQIKVILVG